MIFLYVIEDDVIKIYVKFWSFIDQVMFILGIYFVNVGILQV